MGGKPCQRQISDPRIMHAYGALSTHHNCENRYYAARRTSGQHPHRPASAAALRSGSAALWEGDAERDRGVAGVPSPALQAPPDLMGVFRTHTVLKPQQIFTHKPEPRIILSRNLPSTSSMKQATSPIQGGAKVTD